jgi:hypothetical protein
MIVGPPGCGAGALPSAAIATIAAAAKPVNASKDGLTDGPPRRALSTGAGGATAAGVAAFLRPNVFRDVA